MEFDRFDIDGPVLLSPTVIVTRVEHLPKPSARMNFVRQLAM